MIDSNVTEWKALPLKEAYSYGNEHGLKDEISTIRDMEIEWDLSYTSSVRCGFIVELFKARSLLEDFETNHWPNGKTSNGEKRKRRYLRIKQQYDEFLTSDQVDLIEQESDEEQEFAYEADLRDFLASNLKILEPGLSLYEDNASKGVEYPVENGRIDILAKDRSGRFSVIELKVSRGRNPTIGQLLYYMGWVDKNLAGSGKSRGIIIAKDISEDLRLACQRIPDVVLYQYSLSVTLKKVYP